MRPLIVIPTFMEAECVTDVLDRVTRAADVDVLIVDDQSPDGTADLVRQHGEFGTRVHLYANEYKSGLGAAYRAGFAWALDHGYRVIGQMDADLSHPPEAIPGMLALCDGAGGGADVVIGSRYVPGGQTRNWPLPRRVISFGGNVYVRLVLNLSTHDATAGFRMYTSRALDEIGVLTSVSNGYGFQIENTWRAQRAGLVITEFPITFTERRLGASKMTTTIAVEAITRVLRWRLTEIRQKWLNKGVRR